MCGVECVHDGAVCLCFRDGLIAELQQQVSDLQLYLEEERLNHRQTKQHVNIYTPL